MYIVRDENGQIIACHDEKYVVKKYLNDLIRSHPDMQFPYTIKKVKYKSLPNHIRDETYLVRIGYTYVPYSFYDYMELTSSGPEEDLRYAKDILLRLEESDMLEKGDTKHVNKVIGILNSMLVNTLEYTPTIQELNRYKESYEPYKYEYEKGGV